MKTEASPPDHPAAGLEAAVAACEADSDVEVVVVVARRSGPYRDVRVRVGALLAALAVIVTVYAPVDFTAELLPPAVVTLFLFGWYLPGYLPLCFRWMTKRPRRVVQVEAAAELALVRQSVILTRRRTGLLIYLSLLEQDGHLLGDVAVRRAIPGDHMNQLQRELDLAARSADPLLALTTFMHGPLCRALARFLPALADNPNELPDAPVWVDEMGPDAR